MRKPRRKWNRREQRPKRLRTQRGVIRDVMLSAGKSATWLTLEELAKLTQFPPASISAQLRHLRKPRHGAFVVEKRCRKVDAALRGEGFGTVWEYRLWRTGRVQGSGSPQYAVQPLSLAPQPVSR